MRIHTRTGQARAGARSLAAGLAAIAAVLPAAAAAQLPGLPMLQGPFVSPGRAVAGNYGSGDPFAALAVAAAWTPGSGRLQVSAGLGAVDAAGSDGRATGVGARVAVPVRTRWTKAGSSLGLALFTGAGGAWRSGAGELRVPVGGTVGYRRRVGADRAFAIYATPYFQWSRRTGGGFVETRAAGGGGEVAARDDSDLLRAALGLDVMLSTRLALTVGYDSGARAELGRPGPTGGIFGVGLGVRF